MVLVLNHHFLALQLLKRERADYRLLLYEGFQKIKGNWLSGHMGGTQPHNYVVPVILLSKGRSLGQNGGGFGMNFFELTSCLLCLCFLSLALLFWNHICTHV